MLPRAQCETCLFRRDCVRKNEFLPRFVFSLFKDSHERPFCGEYEPEWYRGIEGVLQ